MAHRTQITLTDAQYVRLREESRTTGLSLAELIRRALDDRYGIMGIEERLRVLDEVAGAWADRDDLPDGGQDYVEALRPGLESRLRAMKA